MKNRISSLFQLLMLLLMATAVSSCTDEIDYGGPIRPGDSLVTARVNFKDFTPTLSSRSSGTAIKTINTLWIAVYDLDGQLVEKQQITDFTVNMTRPNTRPDGSAQGEEVTGYAEFQFGLKNGRYHIYAIANHDLSNAEIPTEDDLKHIRLTWDETEVSNNAQMFGYFSNKTASADANAVHSFGPETVIINGDTTLHAWVRRAASKLTIVYDGSGLKDNIFVYIKSATIKDIPLGCDLGATNMVCTTDSLITDGESLKYYEGDTAPDDDFEYNSNYHYRVTCGGDTVGSHAEVAPALYFYENWQPQGVEGSKDNPSITDKRQDTEGNNKQVSYPNGYRPTDEAWKDGRPYGTYVEIQAYYISLVEGHMSRGNIIYRFMLGKDHITNYAAERNYHYRLTMGFNGYANDVDFHIEYFRKAPELNAPPYYISYLYNHSMLYPLSISSGDKEVSKVRAEIIQNRWAPEGAGSDIFWDKMPVNDPDSYQWHGFLSLRKTKDAVIVEPSGQDGNTMINVGGVDYYGRVNRDYYYGHFRNIREYSDMSPGEHVTDNYVKDKTWNNGVKITDFKEEPDDYYYVSRTEPKKDSIVYELKIPMWTRAKQMVKSTAYTGNNPFVAYQRKAKVKISVWFEGNEDESKPDLTQIVPITQVRRIVNPKGIYRSADNTDPFHVVLKYLPDENATTFKNLVSEGPWTAEVLGNDGIITLDGGYQKIGGLTGSEIDFNVNFTSKTGSAVIRVRYHNESCYHLIFVRKGYDPMQLVANGAKWHTTNLRTRNEECINPMDEGSMFKFGNLDNPLDASTNINVDTTEYWINIVDTSKFRKDATLNIAADGYSREMKTTKWGGFWGTSGDTFLTDDNKLGDKINGRIASFADFRSLFIEYEKIGYGFGILYADGATECADDIRDAYGWRWDLGGNKQLNRGMRGTFVYNQDASSANYTHNIFFPIGTSGFGQRKYKGSDQFDGWTGFLKYAGRDDEYPTTSVAHRPLFYYLWRSPGAIYLLDKKTNGSLPLTQAGGSSGSANYTGWDFNYFTFDFYGYQDGDVRSGTNSCAAFVRLVED